jgi:hypothetical protein
MADWPLQPGQMLLIGPAGVAMLKSGDYRPPLPQTWILERDEWQ